MWKCICIISSRHDITVILLKLVLNTNQLMHSIQQYVIMFVSDLRQVGCFPRVFRFPPPIKLSATI
jgi:hypothetical protein